MTKNRLTLYFLFATNFIFLCLPYPVLSTEKPDNKWSYTIENNIEKTNRNYLLVYSPNKKEERRIWVTSRCRKPYNTEGVYGKCTHDIEIQQINKGFRLNTGEDIVMICFTWGAPLILGTIEYGCCGAYDIVRFYTEEGEYLGYIGAYDLSERANYENLILKTYNMNNATRYGNKNYMLMKKNNDDLEALVFENNIVKRKRIPLLLSIQGKEKCEDWLIKQFVKYGDRPKMTLIMEGFHCEEGVKDQTFNCSETEKGLSCVRNEK